MKNLNRLKHIQFNACGRVYAWKVKWNIHDLIHDLTFSAHTAPPHVLWQVCFGCWVTWSISSWQECYKSYFFPMLQFLNNRLLLYPINNLACLGQFNHSRICILKKVNSFLSFSGKRLICGLTKFVLQNLQATVVER